MRPRGRRRKILITTLVAMTLLVLAPAAQAQQCEDDDYSSSCRAQRQCEQTRAALERVGLNITSCTQ